MPGNELAPVEGEVLGRDFLDNLVAKTSVDPEAPVPLTEKMAEIKAGIKTTKNKAMVFSMARDFLALRGYKFISVGPLTDDEFYYSSPDAPTFYRRMTKEDAASLCANVYIEAGVPLLEKDVNSCAYTLLRVVKTRRHVDEVDKGYVAIFGGLVFDKESGTILDESQLPNDSKVFFKMFDTPSPSIKIPKITGFTDDDKDTVIKYYHKAFDSLVTSGDISEEEFQFISAWANYDHSTYMDLLKTFASPLLKTLPRVCIFLVGTGTNGKSACVNLVHTVYGETNTTRNKIAETGDWHKALSLKYTLVNCPDEDSLNFDAAKKMRDPITDFKTFAAHEKIEINKMREQTPITIKCDFMSIIPMNHMVDWTKEEDAGPLVKRSMVINFDNDLEVDQNVDMREDFAVSTYTH